jgi:hypothetical protein
MEETRDYTSKNMSNWITVTIDDLKASGHGAIIDAAQTQSTGATDPVTEEIENAVAKVRRYVASANAVDADATKVPKSLKGVAIRIALYALMERVRLSLTEDQRSTRAADLKDLDRIANRKGLVEAPDTAETTPSVPQNFGNWNSERKVLPRSHPHPLPGQQNSGPGYANPDGPEDER